MKRRGYLIRKGGAYYRPGARGYTVDVAQAGRFTLEEAERYSHPNGPIGPRDGITYRHESEDPAFVATRRPRFGLVLAVAAGSLAVAVPAIGILGGEVLASKCAQGWAGIETRWTWSEGCQARVGDAWIPAAILKGWQSPVGFNRASAHNLEGK
jgi:hypothetical protein